MATLKELRTRIESIKSTKKITEAMKMVSASKFRRAQLTLEKSELFQKMMIENIKKVLVELKTIEKEKGVSFVLPNMLVQPIKPQTYALFVLASDRGLCGGYNTMIAKEAKRRIDELNSSGKNVIVFCYGKKVINGLKRLGFNDIKEEHPAVIKKYLTYQESLHFLSDVWDKKLHYNADICEIVYSDFLSGLTRTYLSKQVIPFDIKLSKEDENQEVELETGQESLSQREKEIIICVAKGMSNKEIANQLFISVHTVTTHRRNISNKLQIHTSAGLTIYAIANNLVSIDDLKNL